MTTNALEAGKETSVQRLTRITHSLEEIRDCLFECSREFATCESAEWNTAEALFSLAKSADRLRQQVKAHLDGHAQRLLPEKNSQEWRLAAAAQRTPPRRKKKDDYPKYVVRSSCLVKIGLSRDKKTEYEHEVPKAQFDEVIARLATLVEVKPEFTVEDLQEGLSCPSYQTYIVVALCLQNRLLESPWRGTYTFTPETDISGAANRLWNQLPIVQPGGSTDAAIPE